MKHKMTSKSVKISMKTIIVISFFALCAVGCFCLITNAQEHRQYGNDVRIAMREGMTALETMQAKKIILEPFTFTEGVRTYEVSITSDVNEEGLSVGTLTIACEEKTLLTLPFAIEGVTR